MRRMQVARPGDRPATAPAPGRNRPRPARAGLGPPPAPKPPQQAPGFCWQNADPRPAPPLFEPDPPLPVVPVPPPPVAAPLPPLAPEPAEELPVPAAADAPPLGEGVVAEPGAVAAAAVVETEDVVEEVEEVVLDAGVPRSALLVGTVSGGAPAVSVVVGEPPPQAESVRPARSMASSDDPKAATRLMARRRRARSPAAPYAGRSGGSR